MADRIEVKGLSQARINLKTLSDDLQTKISRGALREASWVLARAGRAATYTTFRKLTGAIRSGLGVVVQREPANEQLKAYVVEYPQSIAGPATPFAALVRKRAGRKRARSVSLTSVAFWWRFLEFGTGSRRGSRTPDFVRKNRPGRTEKVRARQAKALARWNAAASRGGIASRKWLRPAFQGSGATSIETFRKEVLSKVDQEINAMPK